MPYGVLTVSWQMMIFIIKYVQNNIAEHFKIELWLVLENQHCEKYKR